MALDTPPFWTPVDVSGGKLNLAWHQWFSSLFTQLTAVTPLAGTKVYYVAATSGGAVTKKLTFIDGILVSET